MLHFKRSDDEHVKHRTSKLSRTLHRWRVALKRATQETLNAMDDENHGDATIDILFHGNNTVALKKISSVGRDSGASMSPVGISELNITTETEDSVIESTPSTDSNQVKTQNEEEDDEEEKEVTFINYDAVEECAKLRKEERDPFCSGNVIWERRRALWTQPTSSQIKDSEYERHRDFFATIPKSYYTRIYKNLVLDDKPLREPLNLKDALEVINAGWIETRKWENAAKGLA